jgi:hypothetical protein
MFDSTRNSSHSATGSSDTSFSRNQVLTPAYYAIVPAGVRYNKSLPPAARLLYGEITALCNKEGYCWAGNSYFAKLYDVGVRTVQRWITALESAGHILVQLIDGYKRHIRLPEAEQSARVIKGRSDPAPKGGGGAPTASGGYDKNGMPNHDKKVIQNITKKNITNNNTNRLITSPQAAGLAPLPEPSVSAQAEGVGELVCFDSSSSQKDLSQGLPMTQAAPEAKEPEIREAKEPEIREAKEQERFESEERQTIEPEALSETQYAVRGELLSFGLSRKAAEKIVRQYNGERIRLALAAVPAKCDTVGRKIAWLSKCLAEDWAIGQAPCDWKLSEADPGGDLARLVAQHGRERVAAEMEVRAAQADRERMPRRGMCRRRIAQFLRQGLSGLEAYRQALQMGQAELEAEKAAGASQPPSREDAAKAHPGASGFPSEDYFAAWQRMSEEEQSPYLAKAKESLRRIAFDYGPERWAVLGPKLIRRCAAAAYGRAQTEAVTARRAF